MEQRNIEQRYAIKFCIKLGDSVMETYDKLVKVFGDEALSSGGFGGEARKTCRLS